VFNIEEHVGSFPFHVRLPGQDEDFGRFVRSGRVQPDPTEQQKEEEDSGAAAPPYPVPVGQSCCSAQIAARGGHGGGNGLEDGLEVELKTIPAV
jgi:hypothetical protein